MILGLIIKALFLAWFIKITTNFQITFYLKHHTLSWVRNELIVLNIFMLHSPWRQSEVLYLVVSSKNVGVAMIFRFFLLTECLSAFLLEKRGSSSEVGSIHQQTFVFRLILFLADWFLRICLHAHSTFPTEVTCNSVVKMGLLFWNRRPLFFILKEMRVVLFIFEGWFFLFL